MASRTLANMKSTLPRHMVRSGLFPSLGNLFSPLQYAVRRLSGIVEDKERADERIYIRSHEGQALKELRAQFEKEVKAIYQGPLWWRFMMMLKMPYASEMINENNENRAHTS